MTELSRLLPVSTLSAQSASQTEGFLISQASGSTGTEMPGTARYVIGRDIMPRRLMQFYQNASKLYNSDGKMNNVEMRPKDLIAWINNWQQLHYLKNDFNNPNKVVNSFLVSRNGNEEESSKPRALRYVWAENVNTLIRLAQSYGLTLRY